MIKFCQFRETRPTSKYDVITRAPSLFVDFTDKATLYQDSSGTTPVTVVTDPIGKANDQSGNAANMLQATTTVTPWIRINDDVDWVALPGISYTTAGAWSLQSPTNAKWQLRITGAGAGTSLTAAIASMEAQ